MINGNVVNVVVVFHLQFFNYNFFINKNSNILPSCQETFNFYCNFKLLGEPVTFQFKYRPAKNFPLDLYYLMDLTLTMQHDVRTMAALGVELTDILQQLTPHYQVAFGYYSDKVAMPFSNMAPENAENPCVSFNERCEKPFDFIHALNFTKDIGEFIQKV